MNATTAIIVEVRKLQKLLKLTDRRRRDFTIKVSIYWRNCTRLIVAIQSWPTLTYILDDSNRDLKHPFVLKL
jgi:hypothetical protein